MTVGICCNELIQQKQETIIEKTSSIMKYALESVVAKGGGHYAYIDGYRVGGKTGTAQIANPKGGYLHGEYDYIKSFAGIFPEENPKYIIYVSVKQINTENNVLAGVVKTAVEEIAKYSNITHDNSDVDNSKIVTINNYLI